MEKGRSELEEVTELVAKIIEEIVSNKEVKTKLIVGFKKSVKEIEDELEDRELSHKYQSRLDLADDQWLEKPEDMSFGEWAIQVQQNKNVNKTETLFDPELVQRSRLGAIKDGILHTLKHNDLEFDEEDLRRRLDLIEDEEKLFELCLLASQIENINSFFVKLEKI